MEDLRSIDISFYYKVKGRTAKIKLIDACKYLTKWTVEEDNEMANKHKIGIADFFGTDVSEVKRISADEYKKLKDKEELCEDYF